MPKLTFLLWIVFPVILRAQSGLSTMPRDSYQVFAYRIPATQAEWSIRHDSIPLDNLLSGAPFRAFPADSVESDSLPVGHYVLVSVRDNWVEVSLASVSSLFVYPVNNGYRVQLMVRRKTGAFISDAKVIVDGKEAQYHPDAQSYWVKRRHPEGALATVCTPGDTTFISLEEKSPSGALARGRRLSIRGYRPYRYYAGDKGTLIFNQPKYKLTDTVRLKAYVFNRKGKRYNKPVEMFLQYFREGAYLQQFLGTLSPASKGSYVFQFPLSDTLETDKNYVVVFKDRHGREITQGDFHMEDYVLDEVTGYHFRSEKDTYYLGDTLHFYASATDANGLSILDGRVKMILTRGVVNEFDKDSLYVPDTLLVREKPLETQGETKFDLIPPGLPEADLQLEAHLTFTNGNNELHEESQTVYYRPGKRECKAWQDGDSVRVVCRVNGTEAPADGFVETIGEIHSLSPVHYPFSRKIDPFATGYYFFLGKPGRALDSGYVEVGKGYTVGFSHTSHGDTAGFVLNNPRRVPLSYTVFFGNRVLSAGESDDKSVTWETRMPEKKRAYRVKWQYIWAGKERSGEQTIGLLYKMLRIKMDAPLTVYPGEQDSIRIEVKDYKGRPAAHVNLTAFSYNGQFEKDIHVPDLPYTARYKGRPFVTRDAFERSELFPGKPYPLGEHQGWIKAFGLDSMTFYKMLYPKDSFYSQTTPLHDFAPEVSLFAVKKGEPQEIYLLYINRRLVYYNGVTDRMPYVFPVEGGYTQIGMRLYDRFIELDSIYTQPYYRKDIVIDLDHLPSRASVTKFPAHYTTEESRLLEKSIWQLSNTAFNSFAYVWQDDKVVRLEGSNNHLAGPFNAFDSLHYFSPGNFDIGFLFEPGYRYDLSPKILRLEKNPLLTRIKDTVPLPKVSYATWALGDTLVPAPQVSYERPVYKPQPFINVDLNSNHYSNRSGYGELLIKTAKDSILGYFILAPEGGTMPMLKLAAGSGLICNIEPGMYTLLLVDYKFRTAEIKHVRILPDMTLCLHTEKVPYLPFHPLVADLAEEARREANGEDRINIAVKEHKDASERMYPYARGRAMVTGRVVDAKGGLGIPGASVFIKGSTTGTQTDKEGKFILRDVKEGKLLLNVASVGYEFKEMTVFALEGNLVKIAVALDISSQRLDEVVVVGYGAPRKKEMTGAVSVVQSEDLMSLRPLQGRVAGVSIQGQRMAEDSIGILIRGTSGAGVKEIRTIFRDYGFWKPEVFTDQHGSATISVVYPDNITGWETFVLGVDRKGDIGRTAALVRSFKPLMAELSMPTFLVEGDSAEMVGKVLNYTNEPYTIKTRFRLYGETRERPDTLLRGNASIVLHYPTLAPQNKDSLDAGFEMSSSIGFKDGEDRKIPLFKRGTEETEGRFYMLHGDTGVSFIPRKGEGTVALYAQNNTLDILLSEMDYLKKYPFFCMEQTSSKLLGLLAEKRVRSELGQPFDGAKEIDAFVRKLEKAQGFDGGWAWWEGGNPDLYITCYVIHALLPLRPDPLVGSAIRNGLLYLQNRLGSMKREPLLSALMAMSEAGHLMDYRPWLAKIPFDSLTQQQQWQFVRTKQLLREEYQDQLKALVNRGVQGMLGALHWGDDNFYWYANDIATTIIAYRVLAQEEGYRALLPRIIQYFLEQRSGGYWRNTAESASILSTILPQVLEGHKDFGQHARLLVSGDSIFTINHFPYSVTLQGGSTPWTITKNGGGLIYLTLYQQYWNDRPLRVDSVFGVHTGFRKEGKEVSFFHSGEKVELLVNVNVRKDADYVMIEVPVPAGCLYAKKDQEGGMHKEFLKNKVVVFAERLDKGVHVFHIPLESRYNGSYTMNPAKVSLMYFPTFYGREDMKRVLIQSPQ